MNNRQIDTLVMNVMGQVGQLCFECLRPMEGGGELRRYCEDCNDRADATHHYLDRRAEIASEDKASPKGTMG